MRVLFKKGHEVPICHCALFLNPAESLPTWTCVGGVGTEAASHIDDIIVLKLSWSQILENFPCPKSMELFGNLALMVSFPPFWKSPS